MFQLVQVCICPFYYCSSTLHIPQANQTSKGWRVPRFIISPWTRGGNVFTERTDHNSDIMFVEKWAAASGYDGVHTEAITQWRRDHMSDLVNAFDFENVSQSTVSLIIFNL